MGRDKNTRPLLSRESGTYRVTTSTAPSTALAPRGLITLASTSTGGPVVYTLASAPKRGLAFQVHVSSVGSSSDAPFRINAGSGIGFAASSQDALTLASAGNGATLMGLSTSRWACVGINGATFSSST
jgi:hypothetical protein